MTYTIQSSFDLNSACKTSSLLGSPVQEKVIEILQEALQAANPALATQRAIRRDGNRLIIQDQIFDLQTVGRLFVIAIGKASLPMTQAIAGILGNRLERAIVLVKEGYYCAEYFENLQEQVSVYEAGHPIPDERGVQASLKILKLLEDTTSEDLVICLISGGGSALLTAPVEGITLQELQSMTEAMLECGATIFEINPVRKHLEKLKGGQLAQYAAPARVVSLILSDVVGNPLDVIASGPTVPDPSTYQEALQVLERYQLVTNLPASIITHLREGADGIHPETPKPGNPTFDYVSNLIIGSNRLACQAALAKARQLGFNSIILTTYLQGEARQAGKFIAAIAREIEAAQQPVARPACLIVGGETTVTIRGKGYGGRNLEVALGAVADLAGLNNVILITLATDGGDGPTDAAGAIVSSETLDRARKLGLDPTDYLARNDSYHFFEPLGDLLKPGPTQTNINDLTFLFVF
jgi:hydroxypyruvate reductase